MATAFERLLITGGSGFVGSHFLRRYAGSDLVDSNGPVDLRDRMRVFAAVRAIDPDAVLHLAALTFVPDSFIAQTATYEVNLMGTLNLLEALAHNDFHGLFVYVSTADAYGPVPPAELPVLETHSLAPLNPYSASKAAGEVVCGQWSRTGRFPIVIARPFNHIGPGQSDQFAISSFAKQLVEIRLGRREAAINVGDLNVTRDFTDVRDVVRAYASLLKGSENGEVYNVCSAKEISIGEVLTRLMSLSSVEARVVPSLERSRRNQQLRSVGSFAKLHSATGWSPEIPLDQTLHDVLSFWTEKLNG